jgi:hypothetical protein
MIKINPFLPNAIGTHVFYLTSLNKRDRHTIGKGEQYSFNALELVHQKYPDIVVEIFDAPERPNVPKWYRYHRNLNRNEVNELYNKCSIFCVLQ